MVGQFKDTVKKQQRAFICKVDNEIDMIPFAHEL